MCWPLPISISFSFLIHRHRRHRSASRRRGRLLAARFLFSVLRRRRRLRSSPNDEPVCFFFLFFLITKKRSIVVSMADRWRILATRNGKPLLFVFVLFPFFFCLLLVGTVAIDGDYRIERPGRKIARRRSECGAPIGRPSTTSTSAASAFDRRSYFLLFYCLGLPPIRERER